MNINYKEPQFELFPANSASLEDINKPKFLLATLTLSTESLVILVILGIMIALFSFSLGVERGKHLAAQALDERVSAAWNVGKRNAAPVPAVAAAATASSVNLNPAFSVKGGGINKPITVNRSNAMQVTAVPATKVATQKKMLAAATPATLSTTGKWTVQLSTYKNENYAQQEALGLKSKGYPVFIIKSKNYYLVSVGQFDLYAQAEAYMKKVQGKYQGSQVRRI